MSHVPDSPSGRDRRASLHAQFEQMVAVRAFEEAVAEGHREQLLPGLLHLSMGSEATAVGVLGALGADDRLYTGHRPHGHFLLAGTDPRALMAELAGRETGLCRGRAGSMHLMDGRAVMATGVVGGTLPIALGHSLALQRGLVVVFFGDGAVQTGTFHETMNMAALWKAPLLFVCDNNGWIEFSSRSEHTPVGAVADYGALYGIEARTVDGSNVEEVASACAELVERIRAGNGPALLECNTSRLRPHYEGDLRGPESARDPLEVTAGRLVSMGHDAGALIEIRERALQEARELLRSVLNDPPPRPEDDSTLVYAMPLQ